MAFGRQCSAENLACVYISHNVLIKQFLESQFTHNIVNLFFTIPCHKIELTGLWVNRLQRNHVINTWCQISLR